MKIDSTHNINKINNMTSKNHVEVKEVNLSTNQEIETAEISAIYKESSLEDKSYIYDLTSIEKFVKESQNIYGQLKKMVEETLTNQGTVVHILEQMQQSEKLQGFTQENIVKLDETIGDRILDLLKTNLDEDQIKLDERTVAGIKEMISPGGRLSPEIISERIVNFIKESSVHDSVKLDILIELIDKEFKEAEEILVKLPQITQKTYDKIMEKLDRMKLLEGFGKEAESVSAQIKKIVEVNITDQFKTIDALKQTEQSDGVKLDKTAIIEIGKLISPRGKLGSQTISDKIVAFIKEASTGDLEKLNSLIKMMSQDFKATEKLLGQLPDLSHKTYDKSMRKLGQLEQDLLKMGYPAPFILGNIMNLYEMVIKTNRFGIKPYIIIIICIILYYGLRLLIN